MKKILCFGDSNTYGYIPGTGDRFDINTRWSGILKTLLKDRYDVIEAGCNNRTCFSDNPAGINQTGYKILPEYLKDDIDIVVLAIGINDLQTKYNSNTKDFEKGLELVIKMTRQKLPAAKIILAAPSKLEKNILKGYFGEMFDENSIKKSRIIGEIYKKTAENQNCIFVDFDKTAKVSEIDGLHYMPQEHKKIAQYLYDIIIS